MNLQQALDIVSTPLRVRGFSDDDLAARVGKVTSGDGVRLSAVPELHGYQTVRPVDVLLRLASATRPQYQVDLYDVHAHWGLLRYLGLFAVGSGRSLVLSAAGRRIVGNQRRVTSEELGIGFAVYLAEAWTQNRRLGTSTVRTVDIDVALASGSISTGGLRLLVEQTGVKRPDYLLISESLGRRGRFSVALLECKGTKTRPYAIHQLAQAAIQLGSMVVDGRCPSGLAVSTVVAQDSISYYALQHRPDRAAKRPTADANLPSSAEDDELEIDLGDVSIDDLPEVDLERAGPVDLRRFTATALRGSWATLADLAGNDQAFHRWAPTVMRDRLGRITADRPQRVRYSVDGIDIVGVRNAISLPGGQLDAVLGVEANLDQALTTGNPTDVLDAQQEIVRRELRYQQWERRRPSVISIADDGSALVLNPR
ncbi:hypothetical protein [Phytohabitans suffuscus]|uniref:hypothetical protein n=1 Tax=Phytohabitans suffuscus TaxID=624315 RepID=UPI00156681B8|nr:hypothetical protein [Phytohabitans suffuscus]